MLRLITWLKQGGIPVNYRKSTFIPQPEIKYLGLHLDLQTQRISIPDDKLLKLRVFYLLVRDLPYISKGATARLKGYFLFILQALRLPISPLTQLRPLLCHRYYVQ